MLSIVRNATIGLALLVVGFVLGAYWKSRPDAPRFDTVYQAVLLDNGAAYFGKLQDFGTPHPYLTEVFYVQTAVNPDTKQQTSVLVKRGKEWHGPDKMMLNPGHIIFVEPVSPDSKVAQLIAESKNK